MNPCCSLSFKFEFICAILCFQDEMFEMSDLSDVERSRGRLDLTDSVEIKLKKLSKWKHGDIGEDALGKSKVNSPMQPIGGKEDESGFPSSNEAAPLLQAMHQQQNTGVPNATKISVQDSVRKKSPEEDVLHVITPEKPASAVTEMGDGTAVKS